MLLTTKELRDIEVVLAERLKVDYTNFTDDFFRRRLEYVFEKMHFHRLQDLYSALSSLVSFDEITYYLSVPQTELFRAPSFWRQVRKFVSDPEVKTAWIPCLSSYHELYSLEIILDMAGRRDIKVTANVVSDRITEKALSLSVSKTDNDMNRANFERLETQSVYEDYVAKQTDGSGYVLRDGSLLDNATFRNGWFMNYPEEKYDLVICRDAILGYNMNLAEKAFKKLADSLSGASAMLGIGVMERPLGLEEVLDCSRKSDGIYRLLQ